MTIEVKNYSNSKFSILSMFEGLKFFLAKVILKGQSNEIFDLQYFS